MTGNFTTGERMLLANAGAQSADPAIRAQLQTDQPGMQGADPDFTDRVLGGATTRCRTRICACPQEEESSGWFDWF